MDMLAAGFYGKSFAKIWGEASGEPGPEYLNDADF